MNALLKIMLSLLSLCVLLLVLIYAALRTSWGISTACQWISNVTPYHLSIQKLSQKWSHPLALTLNVMTFGEDGEPALVMADKLTLTLSLKQLINPSHFSDISIRHGALILSNLTDNLSLPISADRLQLSDVQLLSPKSPQGLTADRIDASLAPWQPTPGRILGSRFAFDFRAQQVQIAKQELDQLTAEGVRDGPVLKVNNFSGQAERGTFSGQLQRDAQYNWSISKLNLDNLRFQTDKSLMQLLEPVLSRPVTIGQLAIKHATLLGPDWAINDLSATGQQLASANQHQPYPQGQLHLQANSVVSGGEKFNSPQLQLIANPQEIQVDNFSTNWAQGSVSGAAVWHRPIKQLRVSNLVVNDIRYTLPQTWRDYWHKTLPRGLASIIIDNLAIERSLLIDTNPLFPFQMTSLHLKGSALHLAADHQWGIWGGDAEGYAAAATFNRQDVRAALVNLHADQQQIHLSTIKALIGKGATVGSASIDQQSPRHFSLLLRGQQIPLESLTQWGWPTTLSGSCNLTLALTGQLLAGKPLLPALSGKLNYLKKGQLQTQQLISGKIVRSNS